MFRLTFIIINLIVAISCVRSYNTNNRIIGGDVVPLGKYPFIVSVRDVIENLHFCAGSMLNERFVLTAAHCVHQNTNRLKIVTGINNLDDIGTDYLVQKYVIHRNYDPLTLAYDIALLKINSDIEFNRYVQPIKIVAYEVPIETELTVIGWGSVNVNDSGLSNELRELSYKVIDIEKCRNNLPSSTIGNAQMCTEMTSGKGTCYGDAGGPLTTIDGKYLIGIVSYGVPCAVGSPDVYTKVSYYVRWIDTMMLNH